MTSISRRKFIRKAIAIGGAIIAFPSAFVTGIYAKKASNKIIINPNLDNLRVVSITDSSMSKSHSPSIPWKTQENLVNKEKVWKNIDKLAMALSGSTDPGDSWRKIFMKPPDKSWSETTIAIKTNNIRRQHTRSAVMSKVCHSLADLGVNPENIHIYDACHGKSLSRETPFKGLPEGCRIENTWGGSSTPTSIPVPWKNGKSRAKCLKSLVDESVDILVNISMCKGHSHRYGGFTMTMKNHFGTFDPRPGHSSGSEDYLIAINRTSEILGKMDKSGNILFPRQQLCIVDGLWSSKGGPGGNPSHQSNFLAMGVLSPAVDYQVATKFRKEKMGWKINKDMVRRMLLEFGYDEDDLPDNGRLIEV